MTEPGPGGAELREVAGTVHGVHLRGRLPAAFRAYLLPTGASDASRARGATGGPGLPDVRERPPGGEPPPGPAGALEVGYRALAGLPAVEELWVSEPDGPEAPGRFGLVRLPDGFGLTVTFPGRGLFRCAARSVEIEWAGSEAGAAHAFFSYALPLWLETVGVPVLHGSAVVLGGRAVGFLGGSGVGKSVLCAELVRLGCRFLADDGLALRSSPGGGWRCCAGPPLARLWPSGLEGRLRTAAAALPRVHDGLEKRRLTMASRDETGRPANGAAAAPLGALYVLRRRPGADGPVEVSPCRGPDALARLIEHSLAAAPAAALGLSGRRLDLLADVVERTPVRLLRFPSGPRSAERIRDVIVRDLDAQAPSTPA